MNEVASNEYIKKNLFLLIIQVTFLSFAACNKTSEVKDKYEADKKVIEEVVSDYTDTLFSPINNIEELLHKIEKANQYCAPESDEYKENIQDAEEIKEQFEAIYQSFERRI